jgi:N-acetylglucosaminyldiphosphoundecaprenol N-acetyl-beta-D-mannosaminyltransferase
LGANILLLVQRDDVLGLPIFTGSKQSFLIAVGDRLAGGLATHVVTLNAEMVVNARRNQEFRGLLSKADLVVPDGMGIVMAARFLSRRRFCRLPGIELAEGIFRAASRAGNAVYLLGAREQILETAKKNLQARYPRLKIAGSHHGYFQGEEEEVVGDIIASGAKILLVGIGSPAQEYFIARLRRQLPCLLMMGIGGSFDVWAGARKRAPKLLQRMGLEWLYRTLADRQRLPRLSFIPSFFWMVLSAKAAGRKAA